MEPLAQYLTDQKLTQEAFASRVGSTQATVSRWVSGEAQPDFPMALRIEEATGGRVSVVAWPKFAALAEVLSARGAA